MSYFPAFVKMDHARVLLVGGGKIAEEKLEKLLDFTQDITIVAIQVNKKIVSLVNRHGLTLYQRAYVSTDRLGFDMIIVATDTPSLQKSIYQDTRMSRTLVNVVDSIEYCDFIFPSYMQKGELIVAFSTGGASPAFSKKLRQFFEDTIPDSVDEFLKNMKQLRKKMPKGRDRMDYFERMVEKFFAQYFK